MTDLTKHGPVPVAYIYRHKNYPDDTGTLPLTEGDKAAGWTETALYPADQVAALVERIETLEGENALLAIENRALRMQRDAARAALKENSDD